MKDDALVARSAVELRAMIGRRQVSPVELMDACIARIEALDPAVNAIAARDLDRARVWAWPTTSPACSPPTGPT